MGDFTWLVVSVSGAELKKKPTIWQNDLPIHIPDIPCVCSRWFFTFYHGKSPLNHHVGNNFSQPPWANLRYHGNCTTSVVIFRNFWPKKAQINRQCFCWDHVGICWDVFFSKFREFRKFCGDFRSGKKSRLLPMLRHLCEWKFEAAVGCPCKFKNELMCLRNAAACQKNHGTLYLTRVIIKLTTHFLGDQTSSKCKGICPNKWRMNSGMALWDSRNDLSSVLELVFLCFFVQTE